jgi:acetoin utilization protein AcuB
MLVKEVMSESLATIGAEATLEEAAQTMLARGVDALLVMDGKRLAGIIGLRDMFTAPRSASLAERMPGRLTELDLRAVWRSQTVRNQMTDQVLTVTEELPVMEAAALMANLGKHPLPVLRAGKVVGTIDRWDVVRALLGLESQTIVTPGNHALDGAGA